jgi:hypothetical protein
MRHGTQGSRPPLLDILHSDCMAVRWGHPDTVKQVTMRRFDNGIRNHDRLSVKIEPCIVRDYCRVTVEARQHRWDGNIADATCSSPK